MKTANLSHQLQSQYSAIASAAVSKQQLHPASCMKKSTHPPKGERVLFVQKEDLLLVAALVTRLAKLLAVLLLGHPLAALLNY